MTFDESAMLEVVANVQDGIEYTLQRKGGEALLLRLGRMLDRLDGRELG